MRPGPASGACVTRHGSAARRTKFAFSQGSSNSITFAIAIAAGLVALAAQGNVPAAPRRLHRTLLAATTLVAAWTILVTLGIFSGATQQWLVFAGGPVAVPSVQAA